ncbi:MAG: S1 RNA-binding domain-containing protein, partial [Clostridia bacterium]|nr:S1 RNA-binding domain-containing protein [Clostridia bacterium]
MQIETGTVVSGKITGITEFGAFMEIEGGKSGMIHISEVSTGFVKDINEHLKVGQEVKQGEKIKKAPLPFTTS